MTTWSGLGEMIEELEKEVSDLQTIRRNQNETIQALRCELADIHKSHPRGMLQEEIEELQAEVKNQAEMIRRQSTSIVAFRREAAIIREYKRAVLLLAGAWDALCELFEGRP